MPKTDGEKTKTKILLAAERLFSREGFRGASVAEIARAAGVNKALVYYYFKNKNDLILSLFKNIVQELEEHVGQLVDPGDAMDSVAWSQRKVEQELAYLASRKRIISVMLMEALKSANADSFLFECAETVIQHEVGSSLEIRKGAEDTERQKLLASEFFTGFIPLIGFVVLRDKWCKYFKCDSDKALDYFLEAFTRSHLALPSPGRGLAANEG